jgi:hypothetical protein
MDGADADEADADGADAEGTGSSVEGAPGTVPVAGAASRGRAPTVGAAR